MYDKIYEKIIKSCLYDEPCEVPPDGWDLKIETDININHNDTFIIDEFGKDTEVEKFEDVERFIFEEGSTHTKQYIFTKKK